MNNSRGCQGAQDLFFFLNSAIHVLLLEQEILY